MTDDDIRDLITTKVVVVVRCAIPEVFGSIKTAMIELFNEGYFILSEVVVVAATTTVAAVGVQARGSFQYWEFNNTKPLEFNRVKDLIMTMTWIFDVEGFFFTCSYLEDWKVRYTLNLLRLGMKE